MQFVFIIAWVGVKFGINTMSIVVRMVKLHDQVQFTILTTIRVVAIYPKFILIQYIWYAFPCT